MRYLLLIYEAEAVWEALPAEERRRHLAGYDAVRQDAERKGHLGTADGLAASRQAKTARRRDGRVTVTDGPSPRQRSSSAVSTSSIARRRKRSTMPASSPPPRRARSRSDKWASRIEVPLGQSARRPERANAPR
jgi:hypothetical protein